MTRWERWTFNTVALAVAATGFAYLWMKYFQQNTDPFAVVNHPWQSAMLAVHVVASPAFILMFGIIFHSHVVKKLRVSRLPNRRSGYLSLGTFAAMLASGYLLQVTSNERWLQSLVILHIASGALFTVVYVAHLVIGTSVVRRRPARGLLEVA